MQIKSYYINIGSVGNVNLNGDTSYTTDSGRNLNKEYVLISDKKSGGIQDRPTVVIRSIQIVNNNDNSATVQIMRKSDSNVYFRIYKTLNTKQYAKLLQGYSVLNQGHQLCVQTDTQQVQIIVSVIEL